MLKASVNRRYPTKFIALPARQCLETDYTPAFECHHGLIVGNNRFGGDRSAQFRFDGDAALHVGIHVGLEKADTGAALRLGANSARSAR
jgi:hypothetical protein